MGNSFKQWNKLVLVACVVLLFVATTAPTNAQDPDFVTAWEEVSTVNVFTAGSSWDMVELGFWTSADAIEYTLSIYDSFASTGSWPGSLTPLATTTATRDSQGYGTVQMTPSGTVPAGNYYVFLSLDNSEYAVAAGTGTGESYYQLETSPGQWWDLFNQGDFLYSLPDYTELPAQSNLKFLMNAQTSWGNGPQPNIWVNQTRGNWDIEQEQFDGTATLAVDIKANDYGPFDTEIGVQGGMNPIFIDGQIFNDTGEDWPGMVLQLGYGLGDDFVLAADVFFTDGTNFMNELVVDDTIRNGEWESFDQPIPIVLPSGRDDPFFFTMRVYAIPEPGSLLLLGLASLALLAFGRPRR